MGVASLNRFSKEGCLEKQHFITVLKNEQEVDDQEEGKVEYFWQKKHQ